MLKHLRSKTLMTFSLIVMFLFSMTGTALAYGGTTNQTAAPPYDYMAVGDSVPYGLIPVAPYIDASYTDIIDYNLGDNLGNYTGKTYTYPGMPTKALLAALTPHPNGTTVTIEGVTATLPNYLSVMRDLRNSEIITLTVGADDIWFLHAVKDYIADPTAENCMQHRLQF